jgi:hypothetical protein
MKNQPFFNLYIIPCMVLALAAVFLRFWAAPEQEKLPTDHANTTQYLEVSSFRDSPDGEWATSDLIATRIDSAITQNGDAVILQAALQIYSVDGELNFENSALYGVDRTSRVNVSGLGNTARAGQFYPAPHLKPQPFTLWDAMFIGPREVIYDHAETINGLQVYVFNFKAAGLDESNGYSYLPLVPEVYQAQTDGQGTLWIEPVSGVVVDYQDEGVSYFVDPQTGKRVADFNKWSEYYSPETKASQFQIALMERQRILALEFWLPAVLLVIGSAWFLIGLYSEIRKKKQIEGGKAL